MREIIRFELAGDPWISPLVFDPKREWLACADRKGVRLVDLTMGKDVSRFDVPHVCLLKHVDGKMIAFSCLTVGEGRVYVLDPASGKATLTLTVPAQEDCAAISSDGKKLAWVATRIQESTSDCQAIHVSDLTTGNLLTTADCIWTSALSGDGKRLATHGIDQVVRIWNVDSAKEVAKFEKVPFHQVFWGRSDTVNVFGARMALSPDGKRLAVFRANRLCLLDIGTCKEVWHHEHEKPGNRFGMLGGGITGFSSDGKFVASRSGWESSLRIWEAATGTPIGTCDLNWGVNKYSGQETPAFSSDNRFIAWAGKIWRTDGKLLCDRLQQPRVSKLPLPCRLSLNRPLAFLAGDKMVAVSDADARVAFFWERATGKRRMSWPTIRDTKDICFAQDHVFSLRKETITRYSLLDQNLTSWRLPAELFAFHRIVGLSNDGRRMAVMGEVTGTVVVLDLPSLPRMSP